jgi:predicted ATP-dependent endonuclease of OLD family
MHIHGEDRPIMLKSLRDETAKYFMKTPPAGIVEYALAKKALLVEGPSEFMLMERFYYTIVGRGPEADDIHIIDIRGLSFLRYLEIAKLTGGKVAIITDNDGDAKKHCIDKYSAYSNDPNIEIFYEDDCTKSTFEIVLYTDNSAVCDSIFGTNAQTFMLNNKTEAAYRLLSQDQQISVPNYIKRAIKWIRE